MLDYGFISEVMACVVSTEERATGRIIGYDSRGNIICSIYSGKDSKYSSWREYNSTGERILKEVHGNGKVSTFEYMKDDIVIERTTKRSTNGKVESLTIVKDATVLFYDEREI